MAITDDNKLRSIAGIVGIGSIALLGVTACDDGGADGGAEDDAAVETDEGGLDEGAEAPEEGAEGEEEEGEL